MFKKFFTSEHIPFFFGCTRYFIDVAHALKTRCACQHAEAPVVTLCVKLVAHKESLRPSSIAVTFKRLCVSASECECQLTSIRRYTPTGDVVDYSRRNRTTTGVVTVSKAWTRLSSPHVARGHVWDRNRRR